MEEYLALQIPRTPLGQLNSKLLRSTSASRGKRATPKRDENARPAWRAGTFKEIFLEGEEKQPQKRRRTVGTQFPRSPWPEPPCPAEIRDLEADNSAYQLENAELQDANRELHEKIVQMESAAQDSEKALRVLSEEMSQRQVDLETVRDDFVASQAAAKDAASEACACIERLEEENSESQDSVLVLQTSVRALEEQVSELSRDARKADEDARKADEDAAVMLQVTREARERLERAERDYQSLVRRNEALDFQNNELVVNLEQARQELYERTRQLCEERTSGLRSAMAGMFNARPPPPPASLPRDSPNAGNCCVCLEPLAGARCAATKCGHVFHSQCLSRALNTNFQCPTCRHVCFPSSLLQLYL